MPAPSPAATLRALPASVLCLTGTAEGRGRVGSHVGTGLAAGAFRPVVDRVLEGLESMPQAHRHLESNAHLGKTEVTVNH
ncbi:zinc-binding dehydrogenase [Streptomyces sp. GC420]|uniref:zinc-binding dehydrogenase n=1 Tax=Streptomyces sp. GC420 TaxID=2697568 RepID=UPI001414EA07|nr:zinc-binding dehydrogenase [Streptomyces sp. GC420]NBM19365.1 zinc-binding dehydrogenase [Streptomyces sp. GC420]